MDIQARLTHRALELLNLPEDKPAFILDIGCGSGLSGEVLEEYDYEWVGVDISPSMLDVAREREVEGDLFLMDIGQGFGFRPGCFDGAISISVIQWLCNADQKSHRPKYRLTRFFQTLYTALARGARAVFQFYPENDSQIELITTSALKAGFTGGLVIDYPNSSKAKKYFLCLFAGQAENGVRQELPKALGEDGEECVDYVNERIRNRSRRQSSKRKSYKDKDWINKKKEQARSKGKSNVANDSRYTGRKRRPRF